MQVSSKLRRWRRSRRYRATARQLRSLAPQDLQALGIPPSQIDHLACEAARTYPGW